MSKFSCFVIGNGIIPLKCLEILNQEKHQVLGIHSTDGSLQKWAEEYEVPHTTDREIFKNLIIYTKYDYLFSINNGWIIPPEIIEKASKSTINYHDSPLPKYAGLNSTSWAIINNEIQHAISWHEVSLGIDTGRIFKQKIIPIHSDDTVLSLNFRCFEAAVSTFVELVQELSEDRVKPVAQDLSKRSYYGSADRPKAACILSFEGTTQENYSLVRALDFGHVRNPLGLPKLWLPGGVIAVGGANPITTTSGQPGQVLSLDKKGLCVATADSAILLSRFSTLAGQAISEDFLEKHYGVHTGVFLPILDSSFRDKITCDNLNLCRQERSWAKILLEVFPFQHPYLRNQVSKVNIESSLHRYPIKLPNYSIKSQLLLAFFAAYCARLSTETEFDLALQTQAQREFSHELFSQKIPFRIQLKVGETFIDFRRRFEISLKHISKLCSYALDIFSRYPELNDRVLTTSFFVGIACTNSFNQLDWHSLDSKIIFVAYEDGSPPELVHDGALDNTLSKAIVQQLESFIESAFEEPQRPLHLLPLLSEVQRCQVLFDWNQTSKVYPRDRCIHDIFTEQALRTPDLPAICFSDKQLTYQELDRRSNQLAHWLHKLNTQPDTLILLCIPHSLELIVGLLGILKAGGTYVPVDPTYPADRIKYFIEDSSAQIVVTTSKLQQTLFVGIKDAICLDEQASILLEFSSDPIKTEVKPENLAYVIYTSGSTGQPKGVEISHRSLINHSWAIADNYGLEVGDRMLQSASISFDVAGEQIYPALFRGAMVVIQPDDLMKSFKRFSEFITSQAITAMILPTAFWHEWTIALEESGQRVPPSVRMLSVGTEKALVHRLQQWQKVSEGRVTFFQGYGPTETTVTSIMYKNDGQALDTHSVLPIGRPLPNTKIYILDQHLQPVPVGLPGELYIGGDGLARGYLHRPKLTKEKFLTNPFSRDLTARLYRTGDLVRYLANGNIEFLRRSDNQVKIRGFRVELGEIEAVLSQHPIICQTVVVAREDVHGDKRLVAYVVLDTATVLTSSDLRCFLQAKLPEHMVPNFFVFLNTLPLSPNGKIDLQALPTPNMSAKESGKIFVAAKDDLEQELTKIWERVLAIKSIGIRDNFFNLGGHSLLAVRLFAQIEQKFDKNLPLATLFKAPTIEQLASFIRQDKPTEELWGSLVPLQIEGSRPALFCIHGGGFNVFVYRQLAEYLGADRAVYALQARGLDGGSILDRVEDMATDYIQQIKTIQPQGPYLLSGLSNGGHIALEMAQQLQSSGETVALVAMFDSYGPEAVKLLPPFRRFLSSLFYVLQYSVPKLIAQSRQSGQNIIVVKLNKAINNLFLSRDKLMEEVDNLERDSLKNIEDRHTSKSREFLLERSMNRFSSYVLEHSPWAFFSPSAQLRDNSDQVANMLKKLEESYGKVYKTYSPQPYQGKIVAFQAMESPPGYQIAPQLGWGKIAMDGVELHKIPGNHTSIMESPLLAQKMKACLEKATDNNCSS